jgi:hypothetical protein
MILIDILSLTFCLAFGLACGLTLLIDRLRTGKFPQGYRGVVSGPVAVAVFSAVYLGLGSPWFLGFLLLSVAIIWQLKNLYNKAPKNALYSVQRMNVEIGIGVLVGVAQIIHYR